MKQLISAIIMALILSGCAASAGKQIKQEQLNDLVKGKTTYQEVISKLGKPNTVTTFPNGHKQVLYSFNQTTTNAASFIPFVGLFVGGGETTSSSVTLTFDNGGVLEDYSTSESNQSVKL